MQKTAYELRNSDWSSDVCSSDLRVNTGIDYVLCEADLRAGRIANFSQCNRIISVLRRSGGNPNLKPEESESWSFGAVFSPPLGDGWGKVTFTVDRWRIKQKNVVGQIGRASCRERVCQYV